LENKIPAISHFSSPHIS